MARPQSLRQSLPDIIRFMRYFSPVLRKQRSLIAGSFTALFAEVLLRILEPWPLKFIIDRIVVTSPTAGRPGIQAVDALDTMTLLTLAALSVVIIAGLRALAAYFSTVGFSLVGNRLLTEVRNTLYRHLQCLSLSFHSRSRSGDLTLRVISDVGLMKDVVVTALLPLLGNIFILVGMFAVMFWLNWQLALVALAIAPMFFLSAVRKSQQIQHVARKQRRREGAMAATAAESIGAIKVVQALSLDRIFFKVFSNQSNKTLKQDVKAKRLEAGLERSVDVLVAFATALVLWFGASLVLGNELTPGELLVFLFYLNSAFKPVRNFAKYTGRLAKASAAGERVLDVLERKPDVYDLPGATRAPAFQGEVRFEDVSFAYEPGRPVLENINFKVPAGKNVALVGASGIGKSTLVGLILRLYDTNHGRVLIDGHDIREFTLASLRGQISVMLQDTLLFAASVRDNIAYGAPDATPREIEAAARFANAHEFIEALPRGYDTILGERGVTLSSGQRQRIAVARTAIRNSPILILDEPTAGLDEENERALIDALERLAQGRTTFLVTHNLHHAAHSDMIMFLEGGHVIESGTHAQLMQANGRYAALYRMQTATRICQEENAYALTC